MVSEPGLAAFVFDAYGTLFDVHSVIERCEHHFPGSGTELSRLWRAKQLEYSWLRSLMGCHEDFWQLTGEALGFACRSLGLACPEGVRDDLTAAYLRLETFPEVKGALAELRGVPLAILSNGSPEMLRAVVEHQGLADAFTAVISVEEAGIFKPHPSVYALAPRRLGVPKEAIGFVSSNGWDVAGAANFGFRAFWINRTGSPAENLPGRPAQVLQGLGELRAWIR
jgi:2-haloacid dehalogenase